MNMKRSGALIGSAQQDRSRGRLVRQACLMVTGVFVIAGAEASQTLVNFDFLSDGEVVANQISGLVFTNAMVAAAGQSLNEFEFPPRSASNVVFDHRGAISIAFSKPILDFSAYFTYAEPIRLEAYGFGGILLGEVVSDPAFMSNLALSGSPGSSPNSLLSIASSSPIWRVDISGSVLGSSYTMDDVVYLPVPEPDTYAMLLAGLAIIGAAIRRR
jgi:hypothetical protein